MSFLLKVAGWVAGRVWSPFRYAGALAADPIGFSKGFAFDKLLWYVPSLFSVSFFSVPMLLIRGVCFFNRRVTRTHYGVKFGRKTVAFFHPYW